MSELTEWKTVEEPIHKQDGCVQSKPEAPNENSHNIMSTGGGTAHVSQSCDNLLISSEKPSLSRSQSCVSLHSYSQYENFQPQSEHYVEGLSPNLPAKAPSLEASKEEYLQEINIRLMRELEEKTATLQQLQENYEHLLLKYAEAQNKIDNLRFQSSAQAGESSIGSGRKRKKCFVKKIPRPSVYAYKNTRDGKDTCTKDNLADQTAKADRPSTLAVDLNTRNFDKEGLKAVTPTDSEGMSSIVTSMSGHSKILTKLDEKEEKKQPLKTEVLESTLPVFDKVTHWQNSLPPLDMIEKPDTSFFDLVETPSTRYNELPLSDLENIPETPEWSSQQALAISQMGMKRYLRTLSLPTSLTKRNMLAQIYKKKNNHTIDISVPGQYYESPTAPNLVQRCPEADSTDGNVMLRRKIRPPFLRSSSLPIYQCDSPRPTNRYPVPPLNFENLTLTEDESSPDLSKNTEVTPTFHASHDCSFQTLDSLNSCKASVSEVSTTPRQSCLALHKSTSITPDRTKVFFYEGSREFALNCCNVCGELVESGKAASYHGVLRSDDTKQPICRSFSFSSSVASPPQRFSSGVNQDAIEAFDLFTSNLKARSHITMKALTAHVNKS